MSHAVARAPQGAVGQEALVHHQRAEPSGPMLVSRQNPDGWRLEDLIAQLRAELAYEALGLDTGTATGRSRLAARQKIMTALYEAEGRQRVLVQAPARPG
ncbi:MAG: hypothetical protein NVS3B5_24040 [Sphingomicrobium sp.]